MNERQEAILEKRLALIESITGTATQIIKAAHDLPKKNKYFFKRKYIRGLSRQNKRKTKQKLFAIALAVYMGRAQFARIVSTPIPKFNKGS